MLEAGIKDALIEYFKKLTTPVQFGLSVQPHAKKEELKTMLEDLTSISDKITIIDSNSSALRNGISFELLSDGTSTGMIFSGIPGGHEFNSLIMATLQTGGVPVKLDETVKNRLAGIEEELHFETIVSLSCHNCPEVVQALNEIALINPLITHEMIDGGLFPEINDERKIMGVPAVFLNGETFINGKIDQFTIIEKLLAKYPSFSDTSPTNSITANPTTTGEKTEIKEYDVAVIGGGPGGVASAIYIVRKGLSVVLITDRIGGQVKDTMDIENFISVAKTTGPKLSGSLQEHMKDYDIVVRDNTKVSNLDTKNNITLNTGEFIKAKAVIIATGAKWKELNVPGEQENLGNGVAYCPHCDGPFFKGKDVIVVGGGNSGVEAALDLAGIVKHVTVVEFSDRLMADKVLIERLNGRSNTDVVLNAATKEIVAGSDGVEKLIYEDRVSKEIKSVDASGVFIQIGLIPNSDIFKDFVETNRYGEIVVDDKCRTSQDGIFACGDVTTTPYKQIIVAMGEGAKAGLSAFEYLLMTNKIAL